MIEIKNLTKLFDTTVALNNISFNIEDGSIFGLVGSNGAGKSTLLRIMSGVFMPDNGNIYIDKRTPFENMEVKEETLFVSDFPYFFTGATVDSMAKYYASIYKNWSDEKFSYLKTVFPIKSNQKITTMSKGMQRQAAILLTLSAMPKYILFDEVFDGLDPIIRELVKKLLIEYVEETKSTVVIASHNLRELEGFCDHIGLLHLGGILHEHDIDSSKLKIYRVQIALNDKAGFETLKDSLDIVNSKENGKVIEFTAKGEKEDIVSKIEKIEPLFYELLPLTLEELFISEMEVAGYDIENIIKK